MQAKLKAGALQVYHTCWYGPDGAKILPGLLVNVQSHAVGFVHLEADLYIRHHDAFQQVRFRLAAIKVAIFNNKPVIPETVAGKAWLPPVGLFFNSRCRERKPRVLPCTPVEGLPYPNNYHRADINLPACIIYCIHWLIRCIHQTLKMVHN